VQLALLWVSQNTGELYSQTYCAMFFTTVTVNYAGLSYAVVMESEVKNNSHLA